ncbi:glutamate-cysteine ligase family protein [Ferrimonas pelagia]|uniref:Glutamate--cysteine ligase n=1 Tax=Ferrimonas pelagia TaxID=1177826 RepID=A0ABP9FGJ7_9GAMM
MGQSLQQRHHRQQDFEQFAGRLQQDLQDLAQLLAEPGWGNAPATLGAELEFYLTDDQQRPMMANQALLSAADDPLLTPELNRFNLEFNCPYTLCRGQPFHQLSQLIQQKHQQLRQLAAPMGCQVSAIGILPTLTRADFGLDSMTDEPRYHRLTEQLSQQRGGPFQININGAEPLQITADDMTLEGANTSLQLHLRVAPSEFAARYNAIQLATPFALALAANSPLFLGHKLWHETRIPLFKQSIDSRNLCNTGWKRPARVSFGKGYVRHSALELFRQGASLFPILLPEPESSLHRPDQGPALSALRLHNGTVWSWNRPVYDPADGGHLRIELRSLPAGPTPQDMMANAALVLGLSQALLPQLDQLLDALPFEFAEYNFYRAAQFGLNAKLLWPNARGTLTETPLTALLPDMLARAGLGLRQMGIDAEDSAPLLALLSQRLASGQTGAVWQTRTLDALQAQCGERRQALAQMFTLYQQHADRAQPVGLWEIPTS